MSQFEMTDRLKNQRKKNQHQDFFYAGRSFFYVLQTEDILGRLFMIQFIGFSMLSQSSQYGMTGQLNI